MLILFSSLENWSLSSKKEIIFSGCLLICFMQISTCYNNTAPDLSKEKLQDALQVSSVCPFITFRIMVYLIIVNFDTPRLQHIYEEPKTRFLIHDNDDTKRFKISANSSSSVFHNELVYSVLLTSPLITPLLSQRERRHNS
jgi:hypothetical protein